MLGSEALGLWAHFMIYQYVSHPFHLAYLASAQFWSHVQL